MREIPGYSGYFATEDGKIMGIKGQWLRQHDMGEGYLYVPITPDGEKNKSVSVHRLIAKAFVPNPKGNRQVNHIDGNKKNNYASNLEWVTSDENMSHSHKIGLRTQKLDRNNGSKITREKMAAIARMYCSGETIGAIGRAVGVSTSCIALAVSGDWVSTLDDNLKSELLAEKARRALCSFITRKRTSRAKAMLSQGAARTHVQAACGISKTHVHRLAAGLAAGTYVAVRFLK